MNLNCDEYDAIGGFSEGITRVRVDGREWHIDKNWEQLYPERYDSVGDFINGIA